MNCSHLPTSTLAGDSIPAEDPPGSAPHDRPHLKLPLGPVFILSVLAAWGGSLPLGSPVV